MGKSSTSFRPGQSGNPSGRPPSVSPEKWEDIKADKQAVKDCVRIYLKLSQGQMVERLQDPDIGNFEHIVAELVQRAKGDHNTAKVLLEMAFGDMGQGPQILELSLAEQEIINDYRARMAKIGVITIDDES